MSIETVLQQLLDHPTGKKAFLDLQMELIKLPIEEMEAISTNKEFSLSQKQTIILYKKQQLRDAMDNDAQLKKLISNLSVTHTDSTAKQGAWKIVIDILLRAYPATINSDAKFKIESGMIDLLATAALAYVEEFNGKLQDNKQFAAQVTQLIFIVANLYAMDKQSAKCNEWYDVAEKFIFVNYLDNTKELAIYYNLRVEDLLRGFFLNNDDRALDAEPFPAKIMYYLQIAWKLHFEIGSNLATNTHMRYTLMNLVMAKSQELKHRLQMSAVMTPELMADFESEAKTISNLLDQLKPYIHNDGYLKATVFQTEAMLYMLKGEFSNAIDKLVSALYFMPDDKTWQKANLLNDVANMHVAMGTILYKAANLKDMLQEVEEHPYAKMACKIFAAMPLEVDPVLYQDQMLDVANNYIMLAIYCYVHAHQIYNNLEQPWHMYAEQAQHRLQQLGVEESLIEILYFDDKIEDVIKEDSINIVVRPKVASSISLVSMFATKVQQGLGDLHNMIANSPYNPFNNSSTTAPKP